MTFKNVYIESFPELVGQFQRALYQHSLQENCSKLYGAEEMKEFAERNAPGLFGMIERALTGDYPEAERRSALRNQRVVGELHRYAYFCNQVRIIFITLHFIYQYHTGLLTYTYIYIYILIYIYIYIYIYTSLQYLQT